MMRRFGVVVVAFAGLLLVAGSASASIFRITTPSPAADAAFGTAVAGLGDQNGDGVPDFAGAAVAVVDEGEPFR